MSEFQDFPPGDEIPGQSDDAGSSPEDRMPEQFQENPASTETQGGEDWNSEAWKPVFETLPNEFHNLVKPHLKARDEWYQSELEKYAGFNDFLEVDPKSIATGLTLYDTINTPDGARQIYEGLADVLGISKEQAKEIVAEVQENQPDPEDEDPRDRELRELRSQVEGAQSWMQKQDYERTVQAQSNDIDKSVQALMQADATLKPGSQRFSDLMFRANSLAQSGFTGDFVREAYKQQREYNDSILEELQSRNQAPASAPIHMPPSGGNPGSGIDPATRNEDQRREAFAQRLAQAANGSGF